MQEEWNKTVIFATPNEIRPKSRYSQQSSVNIKAILVTEDQDDNLNLLINLGFSTRRVIHHYVLHAVMQQDIQSTTRKYACLKKFPKSNHSSRLNAKVLTDKLNTTSRTHPAKFILQSEQSNSSHKSRTWRRECKRTAME